MSQYIPIERLTIGSTIMIDEGAHGLCAYVVEDIEPLHQGVEFRVTYSNGGRWTETTSFEAGDLVNADRKPLGLNDVTARVCADILSTAGVSAASRREVA